MYERDFEESKRHASDEFGPLVDSYERNASFRNLFFSSILIWGAALLVLFLLTAYRPVFNVPVLEAWRIEAEDQTGRQEGLPVKMKNANLALAFREYLGRAVGAIPPGCALTDWTLPLPKAENDSKPGQPLFLSGFGLDPGNWWLVNDNSAYQPCSWRNTPWSFLAALSPDIGPVQKFTLFLLIVGLTLLRQHRRLQKIDGESFPITDHRTDEETESPNSGNNNNDGDREGDFNKRAQHPISVLAGAREKVPEKERAEPFYPVRNLTLDSLTAASSRTAKYKVRIQLIRRSMLMRGTSLVGPMDLVLDILKAGAHSGLVGAAEKRMRLAVFEYREQLIHRLWPADYLLWLMPTIGFLGTIYGISASLVRAKGLFDGSGDVASDTFSTNIQKVVDGLGVAFDTTSMALACAAILYWYLRRTEAGVVDLGDRALLTLSNLLVDRMVDRSEDDDNSKSSIPDVPEEQQKAGSSVMPEEDLGMPKSQLRESDPSVDPTPQPAGGGAASSERA